MEYLMQFIYLFHGSWPEWPIAEAGKYYVEKPHTNLQQAEEIVEAVIVRVSNLWIVMFCIVID